MMTRRQKRGIVIGLVAAIIAAGGAILWLQHEGNVHAKACGHLEAGGTRTELFAILGSPTSKVMNPTGTRLTLQFRSPLFASHPIAAVINVRDDVVMEIDCGD